MYLGTLAGGLLAGPFPAQAQLARLPRLCLPALYPASQRPALYHGFIEGLATWATELIDHEVHRLLVPKTRPRPAAPRDRTDARRGRDSLSWERDHSSPHTSGRKRVRRPDAVRKAGAQPPVDDECLRVT